MLTFSPGELDMTKAPPVAYHKMLCYVLQEVRVVGAGCLREKCPGDPDLAFLL